MTRVGWVVGLTLPLALGGCSRPGPTFTPPLPTALQALYQAATREPTADAWTAVGRAEVARRHWPKAVDAYLAALARSPRHLAATGELAGLRLAHGERDEAERLAAVLAEHYPRDAAAQAVLGELYRQLGRTEDGLACFERAAALNPRESVALLKLGQAALDRGDLATARRRSAQLLAAAPNWPEARTLQLRVAMAGGSPAEVEALLRRAWETEPGPQTRALLSSFYLSTGRASQSLAITEQWLAQHPQDTGARIARAEALHRLGQVKEARRALQKLVDAETPEPRVYLSLARMMLAAKRIDEGVSLLRDALARAPVDSEVQLAAADLFAQHDHAQDAFELYQRLALDDPTRLPEVAWRMAMQFQSVEAEPNEDGADPVEYYYQLTLSRLPNHVTSLNNLAFHYAQSNRSLKLAQQLIDRAVKLRGQDPNLLDTRGWVALRDGRLDAAERDLTAAAQARPSDPQVHYHVARLHAARGRREAARQSAQRALRTTQTFIGRKDCEALLAELGGQR